jgi:hypothetical protein
VTDEDSAALEIALDAYLRAPSRAAQDEAWERMVELGMVEPRDGE